MGDEVFSERYLHVRALGQIAQDRLTRAELFRSHDQRVSRPVAIGDLELRKQFAVFLVHEHRNAERVSQQRGQRHEHLARLFAERDDLNSRSRGFPGLL